MKFSIKKIKNLLKEENKSLLIDLIVESIPIILINFSINWIKSSESEIKKLEESTNWFQQISLLILIFLIMVKNFQKFLFNKKFKNIDTKQEISFLNSSSLIFYIDIASKILSYYLITIPFLKKRLIALFFVIISINSWIKRKEKEEILFTWKDKYLYRIFVIFPLIIFLIKLNELMNFFDKERIKEELSKNENMLSPFIKILSPFFSLEKIIEVILNEKNTFSSLSWLLVIKSTNDLINEKNENFQKFWEKMDLIQERKNKFKFLFTMINKNDSRNNNIKMMMSCYENFKENPEFLKDYILEEREIDSTKKIYSKIQKIKEFIYLIESNSKDSKESKFITYWLFKNCNSSKELEIKFNELKNKNIN